MSVDGRGARHVVRARSRSTSRPRSRVPASGVRVPSTVGDVRPSSGVGLAVAERGVGASGRAGAHARSGARRVVIGIV